MKNNTKVTVLALFAIVFMALTCTSCKKEKIEVSSDILYFSDDEDWQTVTVTSNCSWTIEKDDNIDWFTVSQGLNKVSTDALITVRVNEFEEEGTRESSFVIVSGKGDVRCVVKVVQQQPEFGSLINTVYGVRKEEQWNTDFYGDVIEDSYLSGFFDPYDMTTGFTMYFAEDGFGVQEDRYHTTHEYSTFHYNYNNVTRILHIEFDLVDTTQTEIYDERVLTATERMFRFEQEFEPHGWERTEMVKIGIIDSQTKNIIDRAVAKRKENGPLFNLD